MALGSLVKVRRGSLETAWAAAMAYGAAVHRPMAFKECPVVTTRVAFMGRTTQEAGVSLAAHSASLTGIEQPFSARAYATHPHPPGAPMVRPPACMATQRLGTVASSS